MIVKRFVFNMLEVNTYVVSDPQTKQAAIIDAGCYELKEFEILDEYLKANTLRPICLLQTHFHFDHIFGIHFINQQYNLQPWGGSGDNDWLMNAHERTRLFGLNFPGQTMEMGHFLEDGERIAIGNENLRCIHVPGHSQGGIAFYNSNENILFSGDTIFAGGGFGRTDLPGGNFEELSRSIKNRLLKLPAETLVYPGHGECTTIGEERLYYFGN